ncbi:transposase [Methanolobus halotolerans]|nr:transposase [Methanolobus halotolerans]
MRGINIEHKLTLEQFDDLIKKEKNSRLLQRLYFIKFRYLGDSVQIATGRIVIIIDKFRAHHTKKTVAKAQEPGIELLFLPPYSPNLNPIESIWKSVK